MSRYETEIYSIIERVKSNLRLQPLVLGGVAASGGGSGGPPGGFYGVLPQTRVAYDLSELESAETPPSGVSLVDNLNHIRYRLSELESGSGVASPLSVYEDGVIVASGVSQMDFTEGIYATLSGSRVVISVSGVGGVVTSGAANDQHWYVDGALATASGVGMWVAPRNATIEEVLLYCQDPGTAGSTVVDLNLNGSTLFTNQALRPALAYDDTDQLVKGTPNGISIQADDVITLDIDQVATGAEDLVVVLKLTSPEPDSITSLNDLADVNAQLPADGQLLTYDGTAGEWVAQDAPESGAQALPGIHLVDPSFTNGAYVHATITQAMAVALAGEVIQVSPGIYTENVTFTQNGIKLVGSGRPHYDSTTHRLVNGTIIRGTVNCDNKPGVEVRDLGIDGGDIGSTSILLRGSSTAGSNLKQKFSNLAFSGYNTGDRSHTAIGLYGGTDVEIRDISMWNLTLGIAVESSNVDIRGVYADNCGTAVQIKSVYNTRSTLGVNVSSGIFDQCDVGVQVYTSLSDPGGYVAGNVNIEGISANAMAGSTIHIYGPCTYVNVADCSVSGATHSGADFRVEEGADYINFVNCTSTGRTGAYAFFNYNSTTKNVSLINGAADSSGGGVVGGRFKFVQVNGDVFSSAWQDYDPYSTVTGWSSFTVKKIQFKKVGKLVFVKYYISGTSDGVTASFTLPYTASIAVGMADQVLCRVQNNGGTFVAGFSNTASDGASVNFRADVAGNFFTASGDKTVLGSFWYEATS